VAFTNTKTLLLASAALSIIAGAAHAQSGSVALGGIAGIIRDQAKTPIAGATITATKVDGATTLMATSATDGTYTVHGVPPGRYSVTAQKEGFQDFTVSSVTVAEGQTVDMADITLVPASNGAYANAAHGGFWKRFAQAYADDWHDRNPSVPAPKFRGWEAPESNPPWPFTVWPYGGSPMIGQSNAVAPPLMTALYNGPHGEAWQASKIEIYGWVDPGFNISSSNKPGFANAPAAYYVVQNTIQLDQATLYIERPVDTVQTDHIDWGFRLTALYGEDYRFTTSKGVLSNQLLGKNSTDGFDPVMAYFDVYFPQVAEGMNVRIGRYVSLPDIEAQLAPNNYTFSHSLTYTYDCYTQQGINATTKLNDHWMVQTGISAGCDAAIWTKDAKATGTVCVNYAWREYKDDIYACANSINSNKYAYNNLGAYYLTWYHKINEKWHFDTESWYQYERNVPSIFGTVPVETGANGAWCAAGEQTCFAPEWSVLNYVERKLSKKDTLSIRNEYFDDIKGQRTGYKDRYTEHAVSWNHWIGSSLVFRPEIRFERAYNNPAYDNGTKKNQFIVAGDMIWFY
jgi:hypothetical protein